MLQRLTGKPTKIKNVNQRDSEGFTSLIRAVYYGNLAEVKVLINANADVNLADTNPQLLYTPLMLAQSVH